MTGQHFVDRRPRSEACARCGRLQLLGIDEGVPFRVSPMPLSPVGELAARMKGLMSYAVHGDFLTHRDSFRIRGDASRGRPTVVATHECNSIIEPSHYDSRPSAIQEISRVIKMASKSAEDGPDIPTREIDSMFQISEGLSGLIIDSAPF